MSRVPKPLVCVSASLMQVSDRRHVVHGTGAKNVDAVARCADCLPLVLPAFGEGVDADDLAARIDGLVLTGGRANVEPHHFGGPPFPEDEPIDPARDATVFAMVRACIAQEVPIFGICRGIQELNVALGGSLHYRVHLLEGKEDHRMPRRDDVTVEEVFRLRHPVQLTPGGLFERLVGRSEIQVNSLHGQGIDRLAERLVVEAVTPDGVIEGVRLRDDPTFTVGVQWHAEWKPEEHDLGRALFEEFGRAARRRAARRAGARDDGTEVAEPAAASAG